MDWEPVITDPRPWHRFKRFLQIVNRCTLIHGVFRTLLLREAWKATCSDLGRTPGPDLLIMAWILLRGPGTFQPTLEYRRVIGQNPDAGDYQKKNLCHRRKKEPFAQRYREADDSYSRELSEPHLGAKKSHGLFGGAKMGATKGESPRPIGYLSLFGRQKENRAPRASLKQSGVRHF